MTINEICKIYSIPETTLRDKIKKLGIIPKKERQGSITTNNYNDSQVLEIIKFFIKEPIKNRNRRTDVIKIIEHKKESYKVDVIRMETIYYIYPSKLNYLEL